MRSDACATFFLLGRQGKKCKSQSLIEFRGAAFQFFLRYAAPSVGRSLNSRGFSNPRILARKGKPV